MGSRSRNDTENNTTNTEAAFNNIDNRVAGEDGGSLAGNVNLNALEGIENVRVTSVDSATVEAGRQISLRALETAEQVVIERGQESARVLDSVSSLARVVQTGQDSEQLKFDKAVDGLKVVAVTGAVAGLGYAFLRGKK